MKPQPTESGNQRFELSSIHETEIDLISGKVVFEAELELLHNNQSLFLGLIDTHRIRENSIYMQSGIAVSINAKNGELRDPINNQNVGSIDTSSLDYKSPIFVCLEYEKIKSIYIPKLTIGEEKILLPAIHLPELRSISIVVGSSAGGWAAKFKNPHLLLNTNDNMQ